MPRQILIAAASMVALCLCWLAWDGWLYLQRGYSIGVRLADRPESIFDVEFPGWRSAVHIVLWIAQMVAIGAYLRRYNWAAAAVWLALAAVFLIGLYDVRQYGTMGSPTSIWTLLLLGLFALLARLAPLGPAARA